MPFRMQNAKKCVYLDMREYVDSVDDDNDDDGDDDDDDGSNVVARVRDADNDDDTHSGWWRTQRSHRECRLIDDTA